MYRTNDTPDHPVIRNMERTGYPDGREPEHPRCPICGEECSTIYLDKEMDPVGCDNCIQRDYDASDTTGRCPVCGSEYEVLYRDRDGEPVACDECVSDQDAWDRDDCFPSRNRD